MVFNLRGELKKKEKKDGIKTVKLHCFDPLHLICNQNLYPICLQSVQSTFCFPRNIFL